VGTYLGARSPGGDTDVFVVVCNIVDSALQHGGADGGIASTKFANNGLRNEKGNQSLLSQSLVPIASRLTLKWLSFNHLVRGPMVLSNVFTHSTFPPEKL